MSPGPVAETFALSGPVLEIGSYQVAGQEALADLRGLFPDREYTGVDLRPGPGVDVLVRLVAGTGFEPVTFRL